MAADGFDLVILGGGSGGYACALRASQLGLSVVLIEQDKLGGTEKVDEIEAALQVQIDQQRTPTTAQGMPWQ